MKQFTTLVIALAFGLMILGAITSCKEERTCVRCGTEFVIDWDLAKHLDSVRAEKYNEPYRKNLLEHPGGRDTVVMVGLYCVDAGYTTLTPEAIGDSVRANNENPIRIAFLKTQCTTPGTVDQTKEFQWRDPIE